MRDLRELCDRSRGIADHERGLMTFRHAKNSEVTDARCTSRRLSARVDVMRGSE